MEHKQNTELDLRDLASIIWKRLWLILLLTTMTTISSAIISFYVITPEYKSHAEILVNQAKEEGLIHYNPGDIRTNLELINTYSVVIKSSRILEHVIEDYGLDMTYEELNKQITVNSVKNSQVMSITVINPSHQQAVYIANAVAETFQQEIRELMRVDNVHIMSKARGISSPSPVKPKPIINIILAFVFGGMISFGLVFLLEYLDNTIKTESDIENILGLPVLGSIPKMNEKMDKKLRYRSNTKQLNLGGEEFEA